MKLEYETKYTKFLTNPHFICLWEGDDMPIAIGEGKTKQAALADAMQNLEDLQDAMREEANSMGVSHG